MTDKKKWILFTIYVVLGIAGTLTLVLCRNIISLNFVKEECSTFGLTMLAYLKWLIIPLSLIGISCLSLIPDLFDKYTLSKIIIIVIFLALAGLAFYYNFFVNADWSGSTLSKIFNSIGYILNYVAILAWVGLIALIPLLIINDDMASASVSLITILFSAFLMACSGHISYIGNGSFGWGILNIAVGFIATVMPIAIAINLFKTRNSIIMMRRAEVEKYLVYKQDDSHIANDQINKKNKAEKVTQKINPLTGEPLLTSVDFAVLMQEVYKRCFDDDVQVVDCVDESNDKDYSFTVSIVDKKEKADKDGNITVHRTVFTFPKSDSLHTLTDKMAQLTAKYAKENKNK